MNGTRYAGEPIAYLNIDCEGHDFEVLRGLDLTRYAPKIVTIEELDHKSASESAAMLLGCGYRRLTRLGCTAVYESPGSGMSR